MSGHLEMSRPLRLCLIGVHVDMTAQVFPIQLVGTVWPRALIGHAVGLEPAVDAGLTDLEPPSRLGFAPTTPDKIHYPLAQIY